MEGNYYYYYVNDGKDLFNEWEGGCGIVRMRVRERESVCKLVMILLIQHVLEISV